MTAKNDNFFEKVHQLVRQIPEGRVSTYGAIARCLGAPQSSRMVGWALNGCPPDVPAHRVVNRLGMLSGKHQFPGQDTMQRMLEAEGILIEDDKVVDFKSLLWDPNQEFK